MKKLTILSFVAMTAALSGCGFDLAGWLGWDTSDPEPQIARLRPFASEQELKSYLVGQDNQPGRPGVEVNFDSVGGDGASAGANDAPPAAPSPEASTDDTSDRDYSGTTEQEEGVQESDVVKSDGTHFYILSRNSLRIVKATPADAMEEVAAIELDGWGFELYLAGNNVVALTTPEQPYYIATGAEPGIAVDAIFAPYRPQTEITVIDVATRSAPRVRSTTRVDGSIHTSRMIDGQLYAVIVNYPDYFVQPLLDGAETQTFGDVGLDDVLPDISVVVDGAEAYRGNINSFDEHFRPDSEDGLGLTSLIAFDIDAPQDYDAQTIVAYPANIYASTEALYLTNTDYNFEGDLRESTDIYMFELTPGGVAQAAAGTIPGRVLNQYSMSEYQGFLRVASTKGPIWNINGERETESTNHVYVLEQVNDELSLAGSIDDLAPGEAIFSARFIGDKGYLVTFEQIDPLFTLDLSDPRNPKMIGELKVPGFSTFIVPMDDDHLLTVGQDTDADFGFANGVRLSIFDVSDFANPRLAHHTVIGLDGSAYSDALYNPKAFTYFPERDLVALPINYYAIRGGGGIAIDDGIGDGTDGNAGSSSGGAGAVDGAPPPDEVIDPLPSDPDVKPDDGVTSEEPPIDVDIDLPAPQPDDSFSGLYVYHVTAADGFTLRGRIAATTDEQDFYYYYPQFIRGAFIEDTVYCITSENVQAASTTDVDNVLSKVAFPAPVLDDGNGLPLPEPDPRPLPVDFEGGAAE